MNAATVTDTYECRHIDADHGPCRTFAWDTETDRDAHEASGAHVFPHMWASARTMGAMPGVDIDAPERNDGDGGGSSRPGPTMGWSKVGDVWCVRVPHGAGTTGDTVTFAKSQGGTSTVTLGEPMQDDNKCVWFAPAAAAPATDDAAADRPARTNRYADRCATCGGNVPAETGSLAKGAAGWTVTHYPTCPEPAATPAPATASPRTDSLRDAVFALRNRIVETTGSQTRDRSIRVCVPATVLGVTDQPDAAYVVSWSYGWKGAERHTGGVGAIRAIPLGDETAIRLVRFLLDATAAELGNYMAAYGRHFHNCGRCGSPLSDRESKLRGLGPTCATK